MCLSCPNELGQRSEQLSTLELEIKKQQQHECAARQCKGGRWGMRDVVIRLHAIGTN